jgi:hypothetical protein
MRKLIFIIPLFFLNTLLLAQSYEANKIRKELSENTDAVFRLYEQKTEVISEGKHKMYIHYAVTILNKNGEGYNRIALNYDDKLVRVNGIQGNLYDENGERVNRIKREDIFERISTSGGTLYDNNKVKVAYLEHKSFPYTVEFEYEYIFDGNLYFYDFMPIRSSKISLEKGSFEVVTSNELDIRYKSNAIAKPSVSESEGNKNYKWSLANIPSFEYEEMGRFRSLLPSVNIAPIKFEIEGYSGKMETWKDFGHFFGELSKGRQEISGDLSVKVADLVAGKESVKEKAKVVYQYLQENTRYVSVQLGIGGWQTFPASYVHENGYGDCKALTNFTKSMLAEVGVESYYALVEAGDFPDPIDIDFPKNQFNHVILCVPTKQDTVWLECTSQTNPFNYLGSFTSDRDVLLVTEDGGEVVHTPTYGNEDNMQIRKTDMIINADVTGSLKVVSTSTGLQQERYPNYLTKDKTEQKEMLNKLFNIPSSHIESFSFDWEKEQIPVFRIEAEVKLDKAGSKNGKRLFIQPNLITKVKYIPESNDDRKSDIIINIGFIDIDTVNITLPENYHPEYSPKPKNIKSVFGEYSTETKIEGNQLIYIRRFEESKGTYPKESYPELIDFYKKIVKADKTKVVLVDKT